MRALYLSLFSLVSLMNLAPQAGTSLSADSHTDHWAERVRWHHSRVRIVQSYQNPATVLRKIQYSKVGHVSSYLSVMKAMHWGRKTFPRCISRNKCFWRWLWYSNSDFLSAYFISCSQAYELQLDGLWSFWEMSLGFISFQFESRNHELLRRHLYVHYTTIKANCSGFYFDLIWLDLNRLSWLRHKRGEQGGSFLKGGPNCCSCCRGSEFLSFPCLSHGSLSRTQFTFSFWAHVRRDFCLTQCDSVDSWWCWGNDM